jgi:hypothetical protein
MAATHFLATVFSRRDTKVLRRRTKVTALIYEGGSKLQLEPLGININIGRNALAPELAQLKKTCLNFTCSLM